MYPFWHVQQCVNIKCLCLLWLTTRTFHHPLLSSESDVIWLLPFPKRADSKVPAMGCCVTTIPTLSYSLGWGPQFAGQGRMTPLIHWGLWKRQEQFWILAGVLSSLRESDSNCICSLVNSKDALWVVAVATRSHVLKSNAAIPLVSRSMQIAVGFESSSAAWEQTMVNSDVKWPGGWGGEGKGRSLGMAIPIANFGGLRHMDFTVLLLEQAWATTAA